MRPFVLLRALTADVLDLFAPRECVSCASVHPTHPPEAPALCSLCASALDPAHDPPPSVRVPYAHGGPLARAIHRAKYGSDLGAARRLGGLLAHASAGTLPPFDVVLPVPLHPRRLAARGYNQAAEMSRALGVPLAYDAVIRTRDTPSQVSLGRAARLINVRGAFAARSPRALENARVLVVDDVVTTGATLAEVAAAARAAGALAVDCLALACASLA